MTSYVEVALHIQATLESGMHIGTGFGMGKLLDERTMQGPHARPTLSVSLPYIPGSSLKGRLRATATSLVEMVFPTRDEIEREDMIIDLFGADVMGSTRANQRRAGRLFFSDMHLVADQERAISQEKGALLPYLALEHRARVALSRERRSAKEDMLMAIEVASSDLTMETTIRGWLPEAQAMREVALLVLAIRATIHLGGHKGRGLGAIEMVPISIKIANKDISLDTLGEEL